MKSNQKSLVICFSRADENYAVGYIRSLQAKITKDRFKELLESF